MKAAKAKRARVSVADVGPNGPVLIERANGFGIYFVTASKSGAPIVRRVLLHTRIRGTAESKFETWKKKNAEALAGESGAAPPPNLPAIVDQPGESRREKAREAYHNRRSDRIEIDRAVLDAVMQSLSSSLQSVAASVRILDAVLNGSR